MISVLRIDVDDPDVDMDHVQRLLYRGEPFTGEVAETAFAWAAPNEIRRRAEGGGEAALWLVTDPVSGRVPDPGGADDQRGKHRARSC
ncbi:hypothetical protein [Streptomyces sp. NPDC048650]|uniref:hypothetical protein n=1 Tax=Streptomyces sp. NPDC048650 TaxID=3365583 RepID=UPI003714B2C2